MTDRRCNATSPNVRGPDSTWTSYRCQLEAWHDSYHRNDADGRPVQWRDPEPILGEPKPWHPNHRAHTDEEGTPT